MKKNQSYTAEFRAEAVKLGTEQKLSHQEAAARLGIPKESLSNWVQAAKRHGDHAPGSVAMPPTVADLQAEVARLRKELARTEMERDIVKKPPQVGSSERTEQAFLTFFVCR
jgi:transposase-like protein